LEITASDHGPGITNLDQILAGRYVSKTGMGMGLSGCRNLVDEFDVQTTAGAGTTVTLRKYLR
jgi:serine/threonine-protein kinase RsbT